MYILGVEDRHIPTSTLWTNPWNGGSRGEPVGRPDQTPCPDQTQETAEPLLQDEVLQRNIHTFVFFSDRVPRSCKTAPIWISNTKTRHFLQISFDDRGWFFSQLYIPEKCLWLQYANNLHILPAYLQRHWDEHCDGYQVPIFCIFCIFSPAVPLRWA